MGVRAEGFFWERQPREEEEAYAAFLVYRDLGPWRSHEAMRKRLGRRPSDFEPIERWSALWDWRERAVAWDDHRQAERDEFDRGEAAKWERRRLQALEEGWQLCQALRARLAQMMALAPEMLAIAPPETAPPMPEPVPVPVPDAGAAPEAAKESAGRGPTRSNCLTVMRLAKLVVEMEWALLAEAFPPPGKIDPLTATPEEIQAYLTLNPRFGRPPPRGSGTLRHGTPHRTT